MESNIVKPRKVGGVGLYSRLALLDTELSRSSFAMHTYLGDGMPDSVTACLAGAKEELSSLLRKVRDAKAMAREELVLSQSPQVAKRADQVIERLANP